MEKEKKVKKKIRLNLKIKRGFILLFSIVLIGLSIGTFLIYGPYGWFRERWITTAMTTMSHQYLATMLFDDETIAEVLAKNKTIEPDEDTNPDLINVDRKNVIKYSSKYEKQILENVKKDELYRLIEVSGTGYKGYLVAIYDPSKVSIGTTTRLGTIGQSVRVIARNSNAVVAINASGFYDPDWNSNGAIPHGTVIKDGRVIYDYEDAQVGGGFIGFDKDNKLILGRMTKSQALAKGIRDGIEFGPFLIVNGKPSFVKGDGGWGIAPRSAIGQRADGIVLFVVINGRNYKSGILGIDMVGLTELMQNYGAVNAANLDGGTSSALLEGQRLVNNPISSTGNQGVLRRIPTAWIVTE